MTPAVPSGEALVEVEDGRYASECGLFNSTGRHELTTVSGRPQHGMRFVQLDAATCLQGLRPRLSTHLHCTPRPVTRDPLSIIELAIRRAQLV